MRESPAEQNKESKKSCTINVGGMSTKDVTEDDLKEFFSKCGDVTNIKFQVLAAKMQKYNLQIGKV